jgi:hypothetical protein
MSPCKIFIHSSHLDLCEWLGTFIQVAISLLVVQFAGISAKLASSLRRGRGYDWQQQSEGLRLLGCLLLRNKYTGVMHQAGLQVPGMQVCACSVICESLLILLASVA